MSENEFTGKGPELPPPPPKAKIKRDSALHHNPDWKHVNKATKIKIKARNNKARKILENKQNIIDYDQLEKVQPKVQEQLQELPVIWQPFTEANEWHPRGPQIEFLEATEDEVLFSGGRGSGKSDCLMIDPLRYCANKNFRGLLLRRTMPELRELIARARDLYPQVYPGTKWREQEKMFVFPSGARMEFGYCDTIEDVERYRGQQYTWLGIDEITQFPSEEFYTRIAASVRTTDPSLPTYKRFTTNPSGAGRGWVKRRWIDIARPGERKNVIYKTDLGDFTVTRKWIQSNIKDNPKLNNSPTYMAMLASLPENLRDAWLQGLWGDAEGMAFPDFKPEIHVVKPFEVPRSWYRFRACDWGFQSLAVVLWMAIDQDNNIYVYREFKCRLKTADVFARMVLSIEQGEHIKYGIVDGSIGDNRGSSGPSIDEQMRNEGLRWRYADKTNGSRKAGKMLIHKYLQEQPETGKPKLVIFDTCVELIEELSSLPVDDNDPEDVDTDAKDHAYDALRYGLMSRPDFANWSNNIFTDDSPIIVDPDTGM